MKKFKDKLRTYDWRNASLVMVIAMIVAFIFLMTTFVGLEVETSSAKSSDPTAPAIMTGYMTTGDEIKLMVVYDNKTHRMYALSYDSRLKDDIFMELVDENGAPLYFKEEKQ